MGLREERRIKEGRHERFQRREDKIKGGGVEAKKDGHTKMRRRDRIRKANRERRIVLIFNPEIAELEVMGWGGDSPWVSINMTAQRDWR